jgi:hypothetical protein
MSVNDKQFAGFVEYEPAANTEFTGLPELPCSRFSVETFEKIV